ncbi:MAG: hypothetical protein J6U21_06985 [Bacteroidales bacterium]|nr:hypothetical protein [Bacteroidales bacterium]
MKSIKYLALCAMLTAGMVFASCGDEEEDDDLTPNNSTEQNNGQNNQNNNGDSGNNNGNGGQTNNNGQSTDNNGNQDSNATSGSLSDFYDKFPVNSYNLADYLDLTNYDKLKALIPAGIYTFSTGDDNPHILAKGTDGSIMLFTNEALSKPTAYIGSTLYYSCFGDDGKNNGYIFYNDQFGERQNYEPAPSSWHFEYDNREKFLEMSLEETSLAYSILNWMLEEMMPVSLTSYIDEVGYKLHSGGKTTLQGVECNYYYVTYEGEYDFLSENAPEKLEEIWLTDNYICLQHSQWDDQYQETRQLSLVNYMPAGTFEENYRTVAKNFNYWGEYSLSETLYSHKKFGDYWLSDEYPDYFNQWLVKYNGKKTSFEVFRRAWVGTDNIVTITITANGATRQEALNYIKEVKKLNLPDVYKDFEDESMIVYNAANEALGDGPLGTVGIYPSYDIIFTEYGDGQTLFTITFDLVRSIIV